MFKTEEDFLFDNCVWHDEIKGFLEKSKPKTLSAFSLEKPNIDYNSGDVLLRFFIKDKTIELPLFQNPEEINNFWSFLEHIVVLNLPLIFGIFYNSKETILYIEHISKTILRFAVFEAGENTVREDMGRIIKASYFLKEPVVDITVKKKIFISEIYNALISMFKSYENISYFETVVADLSLWRKGSDIISDYLK